MRTHARARARAPTLSPELLPPAAPAACLASAASLTSAPPLSLSLARPARSWAELDKLAGLSSLREVLFTGNPIYDGMEKSAAKLQVLKRLPNLAKIDNDMVSPGERDAAKAL